MPAVSPAAISVGRGSLGRGAFLQGVLQGATTSNVARGQPTGGELPNSNVFYFVEVCEDQYDSIVPMGILPYAK